MPGRTRPRRRRVLAWGTSLLASARVAGLTRRTHLDVVQVEATSEAAASALGLQPVDAVVCDLASVSAASVLTVLEAHPHLIVVIVDPAADHGLVLTGRRAPMRTIDDLVAALLDGDGGRDAVAVDLVGTSP